MTDERSFEIMAASFFTLVIYCHIFPHVEMNCISKNDDVGCEAVKSRRRNSFCFVKNPQSSRLETISKRTWDVENHEFG